MRAGQQGSKIYFCISGVGVSKAFATSGTMFLASA
jgi:hypothetical protein